MELAELEQHYARLLTDPEVDQLSQTVNQPNIFKILGVSHYEIRHSNFLAWLLDPYESHGVGDWVSASFAAGAIH